MVVDVTARVHVHCLGEWTRGIHVTLRCSSAGLWARDCAPLGIVSPLYSSALGKKYLLHTTGACVFLFSKAVVARQGTTTWGTPDEAGGVRKLCKPDDDAKGSRRSGRGYPGTCLRAIGKLGRLVGHSWRERGFGGLSSLSRALSTCRSAALCKRQEHGRGKRRRSGRVGFAWSWSWSRES